MQIVTHDINLKELLSRHLFFHFIDGKLYIVVQMNPQIVKGPYSNLDGLRGAKNELRTIAENGKMRMMVEVINGVIIEDPHKINGIDQIPSNGFKKYWRGWGDINRMVELAKLLVNKNNDEIKGK